MLDALDLARLQFAVTTTVHFLFVALTLGLAPVIAVMQTRWVLTGNPVYERMTRFWGQLYLINYALGIVTGLVMELQFGLNWTGLTHFAGDVFGTPLALETLVAFFVEATFLGVWIFGWGRLPKKVHLAAFWLVTLAAYGSAYWIMVANGFLQHPVGFERTAEGTVRLTDLAALLTNSGALSALAHIATAAMAVGGFFMAGVSAWHILRRHHDIDFFRRSLRAGVIVGFLGVWGSIFTGFPQLDVIATNQPVKSAVLAGDPVRLAELQARMEALYGPGDYTPPRWIETALSLMQNIATIWTFFGLALCLLLIRNVLERRRLLLRVLVWTIPVPFVAVVCGWLVREVGRQPWAVYGELTTSDAVSNISAGPVFGSLVAFTAVLGALAVVDYRLIARTARRGPDHVVLGTTLSTSPAEADALSRMI